MSNRFFCPVQSKRTIEASVVVAEAIETTIDEVRALSRPEVVAIITTTAIHGRRVERNSIKSYKAISGKAMSHFTLSAASQPEPYSLLSWRLIRDYSKNLNCQQRWHTYAHSIYADRDDCD